VRLKELTVYPSFDAFEKLARTSRMIPVSEELFMDTDTPIGLYLRYAQEENSFLLESVEGGERWARYSYIGRRPFMVFKSDGNRVTITKGPNTEEKTADPFAELKRIFSEYKSAKVPGLPRFCGGAVGYIGYDMVRCIEDLPDAPKDDTGLPECCLAFFDEVIAFDHLKQRVYIVVNAHVNGGLREAYERARERIQITAAELKARHTETAIEMKAQPKKLEIKSSFTKEGYMTAVEKIRTYIHNGDIFQAVLSQRLEMETDVDSLNVYRVLRTLNPSPYLYYLKLSDIVIAGSSPELLLRVEDGIAETCPIAGTRPRGRDAEEDNALEKKLLADEKERAEHTMLLDLGRNDIGKISEFGSVRVENPMRIEKYSHVMHIVSNVKGALRKDKDALDALCAVLPAGTLSGAPKVRAMQIIDACEPVKRGIYGGCTGYIGFDGNLDTCITIRTIVFHKGRAIVQTGAGIVADSVPEREYEETLNKAKALLKALQKAGELA
jgi:anthranilate synthase component 1